MKRNQLGSKKEEIGMRNPAEAKTKPRPLGNTAMQTVDEVIMIARDALDELMPVLRGEREMKFMLASLVDRLHIIISLLMELRKA